jgi:hypothetical protein
MRPPVRRLAGIAVLIVVALAVVYLVVIAPLRSSIDGDPGSAPAGSTGQPGPTSPTGQTGSPTAGPASPGPATAAPSGEPMPVGDLPGWRQVFTDDFTGAELGDDWFRYEGQPDGDPGGYFYPSHVEVGGGLLTIGGWQEPDRDNLYVTGGVSNRPGYSETYGRFEIRFRADQGTGIAYVLLLWPTDDNYPPEVDIAEDRGQDRQTMYAFLHPADTVYPKEERTVAVDATQWHTVGLEWTPERLVYTLDGQVWGRVDGPQVPAEPMSLALQTQAWYCGHNWEACPDETTPERVNLEIDWVAIWTHED